MFSLKVIGAEALVADIKGQEERIKRVVENELNAFGRDTVVDARNFVTNGPDRAFDIGKLAGSIEATAATPSNLKVTITVNVDYAAYVEFGTRKFASAHVSALPQEWRTFAAQFQGKGGGTFEEFVRRLTEWVHRKGLGNGFGGEIGVAGTYSVKTRKRTGGKSTQETQDKQAAYAIALSILRNGIRPHPYFIPAIQKNKIELIRNLKAALS